MNKKVDLCFHATLPQSPIYFTLFIELLTFFKSIPISLPNPLGHYFESKNNCKYNNQKTTGIAMTTFYLESQTQQKTIQGLTLETTRSMMKYCH